MELKVGQIYKIKEGHLGNCLSAYSCGATHIKINDKILYNSSNEYDLLKDGEKVGTCCGCFHREDLVIEQPTCWEELYEGYEFYDTFNGGNPIIVAFVNKKTIGLAGRCHGIYTKEEFEDTLGKYAYTKQKDDILEVSMDAVAEKFGKPVEKIRIKKEE